MKNLSLFMVAAVILLHACIKQPDACFTKSTSNALVAEEITFSSCATDANSVLWNFGDGATAEGNSVKHKYSRAGVYQVEMKAYSKKNKKWDRTTSIINVGPGKTRLLTGLQINSFSIKKPDNADWDLALPGLGGAEPDLFLQYGVKSGGTAYSTAVITDAKIGNVPFTWDFGPEPDKLILTDAEWFFQFRDSDLGGSEQMKEFVINPLTTPATEPGKIVLTDQNNQITILFAEQ
jgi:hypothetical protein